MSARILIVDDSPVMRSFIRRTITLSDIDVSEYFEARNGREALDILRRNGAEVVVADINMPVMDGESMVREMEGDPALNSIPVIVVSPDASDGRISRLRSLGVAGYVSKPFYPEELRGLLEAVLEKPDD